MSFFSDMHLPLDLDLLRSGRAKDPKIWGKLTLLVVMSITIGYLLAPPDLFELVHYQEGDIIRGTLVIEQDLLLPDHVSTRLKGEQLLRDQGMIFDYDPGLLPATILRVSQAFNDARGQFAQMQQALQDQSRTTRQIALDYFETRQASAIADRELAYFKVYRDRLANRIKETNQEGPDKKMDFLRRAKLDADLLIMQKAQRDLAERKKLLQQKTDELITRLQERNLEGKTESQVGAEKQEITIQNFLETLKVDLPLSLFTKVSFPFYGPDIEKELLVLMETLLTQEILASKKELELEKKTNLTLRNLVSGEQVKHENFNHFMDLEQVRLQVDDLTKGLFPEDASGQKRDLVRQLASAMLRPTVTLNRLEMEKKKDAILLDMAPVYFSVKKGEIIARAGDRATPHQVELINAYYEKQTEINKIPRFIGMIFLVLVSFLLTYVTFRRNPQARVPYKQLLLMSVAIMVSLLLVKGGVFLSEMVGMRYTEFQSQVYRYMFPVALAGMLTGILVGYEAGFMAGLLTSLFCSILLESGQYYFFFGLMGSLVAALPITRIMSRYSLLAHGFKLSVANGVVVFVLYLIEKNQVSGFFLPNLGAAFVGGLFTAILTSILLPFFESMFDVTTNLKLLELSNLHHPALQNLINQAQGTFQHSVVVGNLAEAGAKKIGANPLLARVGAYYHDIGKGEDPEYFYENKPPHSRNPHDDLDPYQSAEIIIGHLHKGAALAKKYRLGSAIKDIMMQHHGTGRVKYFLAKAKRLAVEQGNHAKVDASKFHYPGPKPQTLEAGLVMLADVCEASTRSLDPPTRESITGMVNKVCWGLLEEGELDESGLDLDRFRKITKEYIEVLCLIHHSRIAYPDEVADHGSKESNLFI